MDGQGTCPKVSVIMPVFNNCEYLGDAVSSVLTDDLDGVAELLLIDDGSTDGSSRNVDELAASDSRVIAIHQSNRGVCSARNVGLRIGRGEYVSFCDNDDIVLPGFITLPLREAEFSGADLVRFGARYRLLSPEGKVIKSSDFAPRERCVVEGCWLPCRIQEMEYGIGGVWSGLYRLSVIRENAIIFDESFLHGYEDCLFNSTFLCYADSALLVPDVLYMWSQRQSHSATVEFTENDFASLERLFAFDYGMLDEAGLLTSASAFCARKFAGYVRSFITRSCFEGGGDYDREVQVYERCRETLLPYRAMFEVGDFDPVTRAIADGIFGRRYRRLFSAVMGGNCPEGDADDHPSTLSVAACIVTYNPDLVRLEENVRAIAGQVGRIYIHDNRSGNAEEIPFALCEWEGLVDYRWESSNSGMAVALNALASRAAEDGYPYVLFLDQDSMASDGMVRILSGLMQEGVGIVAALPVDRNTGVSEAVGGSAAEVDKVITSGSLLNIEAWKAVGGYDERLFVDWVDYEFCDNLRINGWKVLVTGETTILHECAEQELVPLRLPRVRKDGRGWELRQYTRMNWQPWRYRDQVRSRVITIGKYRGTYIGRMERRGLIVAMARYLMLEKGKVNLLRSYWLGLKQGLTSIRSNTE